MALNILKGSTSAQCSVRVGDDNYNEPRNNINQPVNQGFNFGNGVGEAQVLYSVQLTIPISTTQTFVLDNSSLEDIFGNLSNFADVRYCRVQHSGGSLSDGVSLGGTFLDNAMASGGTFLFAMKETDYFNFSVNRSPKAVGSGETVTLENTDATNEAIVSLDLLGA
jgi:hypothetical protein